MDCRRTAWRSEDMADEQYATGKYYHRPEWPQIAAKFEAERRRREANAPIVLRKKHINLGGTHYTFFLLQKKNHKPYLKVSMMSERLDQRGTISISAPYVPTFLGIMQELSKEFGV